MPNPRILLTTTSYQDTPGPHHKLLDGADFEVQCERGPLSEARMLELVGEIDGFLCGDDAITAAVIDRALPRLKVISKYGIGLDKIDLKYATEQRLPVLFTPGVNHTTVAEHAFALILALHRNLVQEANYVRNGEWKRITGREVSGKRVGIVGMGRIGKELAKRAKAFGLELCGYGSYWDKDFAHELGIERYNRLEDLFEVSDIVSLHTSLSSEKRGMIDKKLLRSAKPGLFLVNCARGELIDNSALIEALDSKHLAGFASDVLDEEPPSAHHPLIRRQDCLITPHIGSRTFESVERQATLATRNLISFFETGHGLEQANSF